ncbi:MAG: amidohydrolase, partial [Gammaproteobacteria bacterium]|nr:amidohydrolase [Gammaproteobacteria bacterium]
MSEFLRTIPIVDAHHHLWDLERNYYPWLCDRINPHFFLGDYAAIRRSYLPADYRRDAAGHNVVATVHVDAEWDRADQVGETRWLSGVADEH